MTITSTTRDTEKLTLTVEARLAAPPARVWQVWSDPRLLERWWGPPTWPATFDQLELAVGGRARYVMTGPDGETSHGWWQFLAVDEPRSLEFEDGFADGTGAPDPSLPSIRTRVVLEPAGDGTLMRLTSSFASAEQMEQLVQMGMVEGLTAAMGQIDDVLAAT
jgi:uncharacterized protein YndB with AHSA1/START domain